MELASRGIEAGLGTWIAWVLHEKTLVGGLCVGIMAGEELGASQRVLRSGRVRIQSDRFAKFRDGGIVLFHSDVGVSRAHPTYRELINTSANPGVLAAT